MKKQHLTIFKINLIPPLNDYLLSILTLISFPFPMNKLTSSLFGFFLFLTIIIFVFETLFVKVTSLLTEVKQSRFLKLLVLHILTLPISSFLLKFKVFLMRIPILMWFWPRFRLNHQVCNFNLIKVNSQFFWNTDDIISSMFPLSF